MTHPTPQQTSRHRRRGFTLVELLVVILIIVVLAALSFTGFRRLRDGADKVKSVRNVSQLHIANASYASDHGGRYVSIYATNEDGERTGFWYQDPTYLGYLTGQTEASDDKPLRAAPPSFLDPMVYRARKANYSSMAASYGMLETGLMGLTGPNVRAAHHLNSIPNPSGSMAFATAADFRVGYNARFSWTEGEARSTAAIAYRYNDKALVVFFDGHVEELSRGDIKNIDAKGGKNSSFWNPRTN